jgi:hypothetical protein
MPKLSKQTREKRFPCPYCQKTFLNRAGLSGHIQYKHKSDNTKDDLPYIKEVSQAKELILRATIVQSSKEEISELAEILSFWYHLKAIVEDDNIKLNNADYKTFLIVSLAQMKANQRLYQKMALDFGNGMVKGFTHLDERITAIKKQS